MLGVDQREPQTFRAGSRIGRYTLIHRLAAGGMGELFVASATGIEGFEKLVVLKTIRPDLAHEGEFIRMFLDEARLAATLIHPHIAQVFDVGENAGQYFYAMEYVLGEDLRSILRVEGASGRRIPLEHSLTIAVGLAAALHHAHEQRTPDGRQLFIVHRDVSPANVLVSYDGAVKLVDFGIAKATSRSTQSGTGTLRGKIPYMSPEQCVGKPLDRTADIYGLGVLLYEMTTGGRPFEADNDVAVAQRIVAEDAPPPSTRVTEYPAELERVVVRALRRSQGDRYQTAQELQRDLEAFARSVGLTLSSLELGEYMRTLFAGVEAARREQISAALLDLDVGRGADPSREHETRPTAALRTRDRPDVGAHPEASVVPRRNPRRVARITAAAVLVAAAMAAAAWVAVSRGSRPDATAPPTSLPAAGRATTPAAAPTATSVIAPPAAPSLTRSTETANAEAAAADPTPRDRDTRRVRRRRAPAPRHRTSREAAAVTAGDEPFPR